MRLLDGCLRLREGALSVQYVLFGHGVVLEQIGRAIQVGLCLAERRLGLRDRRLRRQVRRHGAVGVGTGDREERLILFHRVTRLDEHRRDSSADRKDHLRHPVGVRFDLAGRDDLVGRQIDELHGVAFQLREHRRVRRNLYDAGRRRGPARRFGGRRGATVAAGCGCEAGQRGEQTDHVLHGVTFRGASVDTDAPVAESSV